MYSILFGVATDQNQNLIPVSISLVYRYLFDSIQCNCFTNYVAIKARCQKSNKVLNTRYNLILFCALCKCNRYISFWLQCISNYH